MPNDIFGANDFTSDELKELFDSDFIQDSPPETDTDLPESQTEQPEKPAVEADDGKKIDNHEAFAKRLKERTEKAVLEERENIAKTMGYGSYDEMLKERQKKELEDNGLDAEQASPIIDKLVKERLDNDPRMIELEELRKKQVLEYGKKELAELTKLTNGEISKLEDVPKDVIELWKTKGSLKAAYMELHGEELILKVRSEQSKGSTKHLNSLDGSTPIVEGKRTLTDEEKAMFKFFNPDMSTEELNKKMVDK